MDQKTLGPILLWPRLRRHRSAESVRRRQRQRQRRRGFGTPSCSIRTNQHGRRSKKPRRINHLGLANDTTRRISGVWRVELGLEAGKRAVEGSDCGTGKRERLLLQQIEGY